MSSAGSRSSSDSDDDLALRIALKRSKVDTGGSSGPASPLSCRRSEEAGAGSSRPALGSTRAAQSAPSPHRPLAPPPAAPPRAQRWLLVPAPPARTRTPESEARAALRERQRTRERDAAESSVRRRRGLLAEPNEDERLLAWVYRRSLTTTETDARRLRRKNAKALRLAIKQSEREAREKATEAARLAKLKRQQDRAVRRLKGLIIVSSSFSDDDGSSSDDSDDPPPAADGYSLREKAPGRGRGRPGSGVNDSLSVIPFLSDQSSRAMAAQWELAAARPFLNAIVGRLASELEGRYQLWKSVESESSSLARAVDLLASAMDDQLCRCRDDPLRAAGLATTFTEQMRDLTHDIEDCIERFLHRVTRNKGASWAPEALHSVRMYRTRHKFATKMKALRKHLDETTDQIRIFNIPTITGQSSSAARSGAEPACPSNLVGIESAKTELLALLVEPNPAMVISIVGFGGSGKTTLARAVYESVQQEAPSCCAWVQIHSLDTDGILRDIHLQLLPGEEYSAASLKRRLAVSGTRYLIVIDDIKLEHVNHLDTIWNILKGNGTIVVTTAVQLVANTCSNLPLRETRYNFGYVYRMRSLGDEDSRKIAFPGRHTSELVFRSAALLKKCDGLPLALASVARKLNSESEPTGQFCEGLCRDLGRYVEHETDSDPFFERLRGVLMDNYISLSDYTARTCLLYLGIFQVHRPLQRKVIIRRWSAEGYVRNNPLDYDPMIADRNFKMLIDRNIIQPDVPRWTTREKTCKTHGIMHVFLLHKSRRQNFITPYGVEDKKVRHLFVHDNNGTNFRKRSSPDLSCVRSLTVSGNAGDAISDFRKYKVMRVLDLQGCIDLTDGHLQSICKLWNLRYLSLGANITNLPKEIAHLKLLETLDISKTKVSVLPVQVIGLPCLVNLIGEFKLADLVGTEGSELEEQSKESKLETLVGFLADAREGLLQLMVHMKNLNKVKIWCDHDDKGQGSDQLLIQLNNHLLEAIKKYCEAPIQITRSLSIDFRRLPEGSLYALRELYNHSLLSGTNYYLTSLKLHGNSSALHDFVSLFPYVSELSLSPSNVTHDLLLALSKMQCLLYLKLKFDDIESFVIQTGHFESLQRLRLVWHATDVSLPVIEDGALPGLVSFQLICESLVGLSGIEITHLKQLKEIALHSEVAPKTREQWQEAAREHPKRPDVLTFTKNDDTRNEDTIVLRQEPATRMIGNHMHVVDMGSVAPHTGETGDSCPAHDISAEISVVPTKTELTNLFQHQFQQLVR